MAKSSLSNDHKTELFCLSKSLPGHARASTNPEASVNSVENRGQPEDIRVPLCCMLSIIPVTFPPSAKRASSPLRWKTFTYLHITAALARPVVRRIDISSNLKCVQANISACQQHQEYRRGSSQPQPGSDGRAPQPCQPAAERRDPFFRDSFIFGGSRDLISRCSPELSHSLENL